jgi:hypothetical protein
MTDKYAYYIPVKITSYVDDDDDVRVLCENGEVVGRENPEGDLILLDEPDFPLPPDVLWAVYQGSTASKLACIREDETLTPQEREHLITGILEQAAQFYFFTFGEIKSREFIRREIEWPERD